MIILKRAVQIFMLAAAMIFILAFNNANAATKSNSQKSNNASRLGAKLATDHSFDELSVRGRYQSAFEGVATVEDEKVLEDLLDYRTNYKDRIQQSRMQQ